MTSSASSHRRPLDRSLSTRREGSQTNLLGASPVASGLDRKHRFPKKHRQQCKASKFRLNPAREFVEALANSWIRHMHFQPLACRSSLGDSSHISTSSWPPGPISQPIVPALSSHSHKPAVHRRAQPDSRPCPGYRRWCTSPRSSPRRLSDPTQLVEADEAWLSRGRCHTRDEPQMSPHSPPVSIPAGWQEHRHCRPSSPMHEA
mmetsp:Transcript_24811/g.45503  ORF Transcript_24811/g.45503 Transcript_24811/m.45503 type:complete len:204 (+) Transcript_24811:60-671(+)